MRSRPVAVIRDEIARVLECSLALRGTDQRERVLVELLGAVVRFFGQRTPIA